MKAISYVVSIYLVCHVYNNRLTSILRLEQQLLHTAYAKTNTKKNFIVVLEKVIKFTRLSYIIKASLLLRINTLCLNKKL